MSDERLGGLRAELRHARVYLYFFRDHLAKLNAGEIKIFLAILFHADESGLCKLTSKSIKDITGLSEKQYRRALYGHHESGRNAKAGIIKKGLLRRLTRDGNAFFWQVVIPNKLTAAFEARKKGAFND